MIMNRYGLIHGILIEGITDSSVKSELAFTADSWKKHTLYIANFLMQQRIKISDEAQNTALSHRLEYNSNGEEGQ